jgi:hypothetical protein
MSRFNPVFLFHLITTVLTFFVMLALLLSPSLSQAQDSNLRQEIEKLKVELQQLKTEQKQQNQTLVDELATLKTESQIPELGDQTVSNLGLGASKVYFSKSKVSIGGYGELTYEDDRLPGSNNTTDMYRFVPYIGYRFNDWIVFNSELEFEHGGADKNRKGYAIMEFMYMDFLLDEKVNIRVGNYLIPVGLTNLKHEPTYFGSVLRPTVERNLIPTTWHENGVLLYGDISEDVSYQAGFFASPLATATEASTANFKPSSWIKDGRQRGAEAKMEDISGVVRVDYAGLPFTDVGFSYVYGDTSQDVDGLSNLTYSLTEAHFETRWNGLEWNGLYARGTFSGAGELNYSAGVLGEVVEGWYTTLTYDTARLIGNNTYQLPVFVRYSEYDLNKEVPTGFARDRSLAKKITTVGLNYKPHPQVVLKADFEFTDTDAGYEGDFFNLGMGFVF